MRLAHHYSEKQLSYLAIKAATFFLEYRRARDRCYAEAEVLIHSVVPFPSALFSVFPQLLGPLHAKILGQPSLYVVPWQLSGNAPLANPYGLLSTCQAPSVRILPPGQSPGTLAVHLLYGQPLCPCLVLDPARSLFIMGHIDKLLASLSGTGNTLFLALFPPLKRSVPLPPPPPALNEHLPEPRSSS